MQLTFSPALGASVPLVVRPGKHDASQDVLFKATFDSLASYEHARSYGIRVEMWTDLPMEGRAPGEWGAVPFTFRESRDEESGAGHKVLSLPSPAEVSATSLAVYAGLPLRLGGYRSGHRFSFTYRLVYASGEIRWLGAFGQNGTLVVSHQSLPKALGIALTAGWQNQGDDVAVFEAGPAKGREVGKLSDSHSWSSWVIGRDGWPMFSSTHEADSCATLVLISRPRGDAITSIPPIVLSASSGADVGIDAHGRITYSSDSDGAHLSLRVIDDTRFVVLTDGDVQVRLLGGDLNPAAARIVACHAPGVAMPLSVLVLPSKDGLGSQEVPLDINALAPATPDGAPRSFVVTTSDRKAFLVPSEDEQTMVRIGAFGGAALVAPFYDLTAPDSAAEYGWKVSVLQPSTDATLTKFEEEVSAVPHRLLPTPPPSPPAVMRVAQRPPPLALPSLAEVSEALTSMQPSAVPSAVSPPIAATSPASATSVRPPTPYPVTHASEEAYGLAVVRMHRIYPLHSYVRVLLAMFAWIWRVVFQRFAFLWLGAGGMQVSESGTESDEGSSPLHSPAPEAQEDGQASDNGVSESEDQAADDATPAGTSTPTAVDASVASPILQPEPKVPLANLRAVRSLPAMQFDVPHHDGKIILLVQAPEGIASVSERVRFVVNGKNVSEPRIVAKHNSHHLVHLDAPIGCASKLTMVMV